MALKPVNKEAGNETINKEDEIYLNIVKNTDKNEELTLNANENIKYYYFDIVNYNEEEQKFNQSELTPYVKIVFNNNGKEIDLLVIYEENIYPVEIKKNSNPDKNSIKNLLTLCQPFVL